MIVDIIYFCGILFMLLTGINLLTVKKNQSYFYLKLLASFFILLALSNGFYLVIKYGLILYIPFFYKSLMPFSFVIPILGYWYVEKTITQKPYFKTTDLFHLIPFIIITVNYIPFYFMNIEEKRIVVEMVVNNLENLIKVNYKGFISEQMVWILKVVLSWIYIFLCWKVYKLSNPIFSKISSKSFQISQWIKILLIIKTTYYILLPIVYIGIPFISYENYEGEINQNKIASDIVFLATSLIFLILSSYLLLKPKLFVTIEQYKRPILKDINASIEEIEKAIINADIIKNQDLNLPELANEIGYKQQDITQIINHSTYKNFRSFLNSIRINLLVNEIKQKDFETKSIIGIAEDYGFKSESTFYRAFKNVFETTPQNFFNEKFNELNS